MRALGVSEQIQWFVEGQEEPYTCPFANLKAYGEAEDQIL
jgi:hypothetical protein